MHVFLTQEGEDLLELLENIRNPSLTNVRILLALGTIDALIEPTTDEVLSELLNTIEFSDLSIAETKKFFQDLEKRGLIKIVESLSPINLKPATSLRFEQFPDVSGPFPTGGRELSRENFPIRRLLIERRN
jgi:hypothetical protein